MDFEIEHTLTCDADAVASLLLDRAFQESLADIEPLSERTVLAQEKLAGGSIERRVRCVLGLDLPGVARRFMDNSDPAWVEVATWHPADRRWTWVIVPEAARDLLDASGQIDITDRDGHAVRRVTGTVRVKVPLYGGRVEGWIVDGLRRAYSQEAERMARYLGVAVR